MVYVPCSTSSISQLLKNLLVPSNDENIPVCTCSTGGQKLLLNRNNKKVRIFSTSRTISAAAKKNSFATRYKKQWVYSIITQTHIIIYLYSDRYRY